MKEFNECGESNQNENSDEDSESNDFVIGDEKSEDEKIDDFLSILDMVKEHINHSD